jgi:YHS domain-containing protein
MNRIKKVYPAQIMDGTRQRPGASWKALTHPATRYALVLFALCVFSAHNSSASSLAPADLGKNLIYPAVQVWLEKGAHKLNLDSNGVILKGYDPVAYFTQNKAVKGNPTYKTTYEGATYYFSSAADLATFKKSPSKYVPQYGGFCANSMAKRKVSDSDPNAFFIIKGKLYVCSSPEAVKEFRSNETENIRKADQNWGEAYRWFY